MKAFNLPSFHRPPLHLPQPLLHWRSALFALPWYVPHFILDLEGPTVLLWHHIFLFNCMAALFINPLYFYLMFVASLTYVRIDYGIDIPFAQVPHCICGAELISRSHVRGAEAEAQSKRAEGAKGCGDMWRRVERRGGVQRGAEAGTGQGEARRCPRAKLVFLFPLSSLLPRTWTPLLSVQFLFRLFSKTRIRNETSCSACFVSIWQHVVPSSSRTACSS